jgi:predicted nucleotidyltransferase
MNTTGLTDKQLELLRQVFKKYSAVRTVKIYGSRAKGSSHARSDVDLVVFGEGLNRFLLAEMLLDLEDSDLPYTVDLQNYDELKNQALKEHIDRVGVLIYQLQKDVV